MSRETLRVAVDGGHLSCWVDGEGQPVLLLHGGPGLSADHLDGLVTELLGGYRVAVYQQRGLSPSLEEGPFTVAAHVADVAAVLDGLGWNKAFVVGHSWGGHLGLHVAVGLRARLHGVLSVDPVGGVVDGGLAAFEAAMIARTPEGNRARARELDDRANRGESTDEEFRENMALVWPAYFAHPASAPPMPKLRTSAAAFLGSYESMVAEMPSLESALSEITVPIGFVVGAASPIPPELSAIATAARIPNAWVDVVPGAGHFIWMEAPGAVRESLDRLVRSVSPTT
jgi:pimeloyl-ACP methyl ester carboxylesterase